MTEHESVTPAWTHREYFTRFRLNVAQYGEILIAQVFQGEKMGDSQRCYDVETSYEKIRANFAAHGTVQEIVKSCLSIFRCVGDGNIRIEVKSKLERTSSGTASVIMCNDGKFDGVKKYLPATHFAVILFDNEGNAKNAWLFTSETARKLRTQTKSKHISVSSLTKGSPNGEHKLIDISGLINVEASKPL